MTTKNLIAISVASAMATLFAVGCSDTSGTATGPIAVSSQPMTQSMSMQLDAQVNEAAHQLIISANSCDTGGVIYNRKDTTNYSISNGQLLLWSTGSCRATVGTGSSSSIKSTWTITNTRVKAPGDTSSTCNLSADTSNHSTETITISSSKISESIKNTNWCWSTDQVYSSRQKAVGCNSYKDSTLAGVATYTLLTVDPSTQAETVQFSFGGKTCTKTSGAISLNVSASQCTAAWSSYKADTSAYKYFSYSMYSNFAAYQEYSACVKSSGWSGSSY